MDPRNSIKLAFISISYVNSSSTDEVQVIQSLKMDELFETLDSMLKLVNFLSDSGIRAIEFYNPRTEIYL